MKKTIIIIFALAFIFGLNTMAQFSYGPKLGLNIANQTGADVINNKTLIGFNAGALGNYAFGDIFSAQLEVLYDTKGATYETSDETGNTIDIKSNLNYLSIPILAKATFGQDVKFFGEAGVNIGMLMNAKLDGKSDTTKLEIDPDDPTQLTTTDIKYKDFFKSTDIGLVLGIGILVPAGKMNLMIDARYNMSFGTIGEDIEVFTDFDPITGQFTMETKSVDIQNNVFSINVALLFGGS